MCDSMSGGYTLIGRGSSTWDRRVLPGRRDRSSAGPYLSVLRTRSAPWPPRTPRRATSPRPPNGRRRPWNPSAWRAGTRKETTSASTLIALASPSAMSLPRLDPDQERWTPAQARDHSGGANRNSTIEKSSWNSSWPLRVRAFWISRSILDSPRGGSCRMKSTKALKGHISPSACSIS
jgi:hypothetical protein